MATMTITVTVSCNGITWSRSAAVEVDTASMHDGNSGLATLFGPDSGGGTTLAMHSYSGVGVGVFANKAKGSIANVTLNALIEAGVPTYLPLIVYSGAGTGFTGAINSSATATAVADQDLTYVTFATLTGTQKSTALVGLKAIS